MPHIRKQIMRSCTAPSVSRDTSQSHLHVPGKNTGNRLPPPYAAIEMTKPELERESLSHRVFRLSYLARERLLDAIPFFNRLNSEPEEGIELETFYSFTGPTGLSVKPGFSEFYSPRCKSEPPCSPVGVGFPNPPRTPVRNEIQSVDATPLKLNIPKPIRVNDKQDTNPKVVNGKAELQASGVRVETNGVEKTERKAEIIELGGGEVTPQQEFMAKLVNRRLGKDPSLSGALPLNPKTNELIHVCARGVVPCKLLNCLVLESVDERALNMETNGKELSKKEKEENHRLCLESIRAVANRVTKLSAEKLASGHKEEIMKLLWEILRIGVLQDIDVRRMPELRVLQDEDEDIFDFLHQAPEQLLMRWVNFCLDQMDLEEPVQPISEFGPDLKDCKAYLLLQHRAAPDVCDLSGLREPDPLKRAQLVIDNCWKLGIECDYDPSEIVGGSDKLNQALVAQMFWNHHGLVVQDEGDDEGVDPALEDQDEGSREERTFRMWMNSLGCDTSCMNLFSEDFRTGWMLLEVLDAIQPGSVNWKSAFRPPFKPVVRRIKSVENCNQVLQLAKDVLSASLVGIGGDDLADGKKKPILALVWQLMRYHTLQVLKSATAGGAPGSPSSRLTENDVLGWANQILAIQGSKFTISSFRDPELAAGLPLLDLLKAIEPNAVQDSHIAPGVTPEQREMNAKYIISIARKLGGTIFVVWEDITEVKPKMILILIASLMLLDKQRRRLHKIGTSIQRRTSADNRPVRNDSMSPRISSMFSREGAFNAPAIQAVASMTGK